MNTDPRIAVHVDPAGHPDSWAPGWIEALERRGAEARRIDFRDPGSIGKIRDCHGAMWHWFHIPDDKQAAPKILTAVEFGLRLPVFPSFATRWHYDEKVAQHYLLESIGVPRVPSRVFWRRAEAMEFLRGCAYPLVFKLSVGAGSVNVVRLDTRKEAEDMVSRMFGRGIHPYMLAGGPSAKPRAAGGARGAWRSRLSDALAYALRGEPPPPPDHYLGQKNYVYLQDFVRGNPHDIRVTVIGDRAFGFIRRNRPGDFRASGSGLIDHDPGNVPLEAVRIAHEISTRNRFQSMAYDFLLSGRGDVLLNEISYGYVSAAVRECPGCWGRDLAWRPGKIVPEDAHVEDFLHYVRHGEIP